MDPLPPVHVHTGPLTGDSSLSTQNDEEENRSVNSAKFSHFSQSEHSFLNTDDYYATTSANMSTPTPRHSNRSRTLSNSEVVANATRTTTAAIANPNDCSSINNCDNSETNQLTIRITTRPIMSWSPQVIHADGSSHTMTIDLPEEFAQNHSTLVITQKGWQDLYHIIATAVAKNTSESILIFWISAFLFLVIALLLFFGLVRGMSARIGVLLGVIAVTSLFAFAHSIVRRVRVHTAVRKCVEECFYDAEAEASVTAANANANANANISVNVTATAIGTDVEQPQPQTDIETTASDKENNMSGVLDGLQELEDVANVDGAACDTGSGFGRALRQRLNSHSSSHSHTNTSTTNITTENRQRLNTGGDSTVTASSNMIFDEEGPRRNRAVSKDGMYCVKWQWEYLGMDAVVKISWE